MAGDAKNLRHNEIREDALEQAAQIADLRGRNAMASPEYETAYMAGERIASERIAEAIRRLKGRLKHPKPGR